jgi:hypothetical protein
MHTESEYRVKEHDFVLHVVKILIGDGFALDLCRVSH